MDVATQLAPRPAAWLKFVARMERSAIRGSMFAGEHPGLRFAPPGLQSARRWASFGEADNNSSAHIAFRIGNRKMDNRNNIWRGVDTIKPRFVDLSDRVWAMPEVCYTEARSSAEHLAELRHQGFRITEQVAGIPTAVMGEWGKGGPVIAFLGEYDALPGLSQAAGVAVPRPLE